MLGGEKEKNKHRETNMVEWTDGSCMCLFEVVQGEEAEDCCNTHTDAQTTPTLTHAQPRAHPPRDGGILTLNKPKQDIGGAGSF